MEIFKNKLFLAPMAGITEPVFRTICREHGADVVVSEMVSCEGIFRGGKATRALVEFQPHERPLGVQIFGADPDTMANAAAFIEEYARPDFIDINSGCPVPKVVKRNGGAAFLRNPTLFKQVLSSVVKKVSTPVTVKIRSGWHTHDWVDTEFAKIAQDCGVAALALHPRSRAMVFSGHSYWERIAEVRKVLSIPLIGNGDITSPEKAIKMFRETGCDSIMIGRAAMGNPWLFSSIKKALRGEPVPEVTITTRICTARSHLEQYAQTYGELHAYREMKKHVAWYCKGVAGVARLRDMIFRANSFSELYTILVHLEEKLETGTLVPEI